MRCFSPRTTSKARPRPSAFRWSRRISLVDQHVDAVRAITRKNTRGDSEVNAARLANTLRRVTDEFLMYENRDRPDYLEAIAGPSLAPNEPAS